MKPKTISIVVSSVLLTIVLLQNIEVVSLKFLFWKLSMSRIIFLPIILVLGVVIGFFLGRKSWEWQR